MCGTAHALWCGGQDRAGVSHLAGGDRGEGGGSRARRRVAELRQRLAAVEGAAAENLARAERAEYREQAHQDKWAMEIDGLRSQLRAQPNYAAELRALQEQVLKLTVELHAAKAALKREAPSTS